jgi:hypothetical protein
MKFPRVSLAQHGRAVPRRLMLNLCRGLLAQQDTACGHLLVRFVGNQTAVLAAYQVDTRTGQAAHAYIGSRVLGVRSVIVEDVLNVQACCRASEDEWPYHAEAYPHRRRPGLFRIKPPNLWLTDDTVHSDVAALPYSWSQLWTLVAVLGRPECSLQPQAR